MDNARRPSELATATTVAQMLVRVTGLIMIVLGALFWTGRALWLVPVHTLVGFVLVLSLWTLALVAGRAGVSPGLVVLAFMWGLLLPILGLTQARTLTGGAHWLIQVLHLLVGVSAIGLAEVLAGAIKRLVPRPMGQIG